MRSRLLLVATVVMALGPAALGAPPASKSIHLPTLGDVLVIPVESPLQFAGFGKYDVAAFAGKVRLSGRYYYGDDEFNDDENVVDLTLYFIPDAQSRSRLPRFARYGFPDAMTLSNSEAFAREALSPAQRRALQKKGAKYASGKIELWVDHVRAGIECDYPFVTARFVAIARPNPKLAAVELPNIAC